MTKVIIAPGPCNFTAEVSAESEDGMTVRIDVKSGCAAINGMFNALGNTFDAYELCLAKPGTGPLYDYAQAHFPGHACCVVINGIIKCVEAECSLALPSDVSIRFQRD